MTTETTKGADSLASAQGDAVIDIETVESLPGNKISVNNPEVVQNSVRNSVDFSGPKQGHSFFGCCCDVRRATIAINIVAIIFSIIVIISFIRAIVAISTSLDDDINEQSLESALTAVIVNTILSILFSIAALIGAIKFNAWLVLSNAIWLVLSFIVSTSVNVYGILAAIFYFFIVSFFIYPHVMLFYELKVSKTMSKPIYPREEQSCCCVDPRPPGI